LHWDFLYNKNNKIPHTTPPEPKQGAFHHRTMRHISRVWFPIDSVSCAKILRAWIGLNRTSLPYTAAWVLAVFPLIVVVFKLKSPLSWRYWALAVFYRRHDRRKSFRG